MNIFSLFFLGFAFCLLINGQNRPNLIPYPNEISFQFNNLTIDPCSISFSFSDQDFIFTKVPKYYLDILDFYYQKTFPSSNCHYMINRKTYQHKGFSYSDESHLLLIKIKYVEPNKPSYPSKSTDESYQLDLTDTKWILEAENYHGFLRGLETFSQLLEPIEDFQQYHMNYLPIHIVDSPSFGYRGVMIDTARHFLQMSTLKHVIDGMLFNKLNVFHWHITDEESFPLQLRSFPVITEYGAYSPKKIYSIEDVREIVEYARYRGVRVIPEVDSPAHSLSWGFSNELSEIALRCPVWANYNGQLDPTLDKTYEVVKGILNDLVSYFPDEYIHLGGDEVSFSCWENKTWIKSFMSEHNISNGSQLQNYYKNREKSLLDPKKSAILWIKDAEFDYQENDILQYWGLSTEYSILQKYNNSVILSPNDFLYIDVGYGNSFGSESWASFTTWKHIYNFNPSPSEIENSRILGAEVTLWAEVNSDSTTDNHLWSRSSAFAERMWNAMINNGNADIVSRLYGNEKRLIRRGFQVSPVTSEYCSMHLDICFPD